MSLNGIKVGMQNGFNAVRRKVGIQTKAEKKLQQEFQQELQKAADKLKGESRDLFVRRIDGTMDHLKVSDAELDVINAGHEKILKKAGIPDINNDSNYDKDNLAKINDIWNPYSK